MALGESAIVPGRSRRRIAGGRRRGSAYLIALAALVVGLILGLALLTSASQAVRGEGARNRKQVLANAAQGGLDYAYWAFKFGSEEGSPELPLDLTATLGGCSVLVQVADNASEIPDTIRVTSTTPAAQGLSDHRGSRRKGRPSCPPAEFTCSRASSAPRHRSPPVG